MAVKTLVLGKLKINSYCGENIPIFFYKTTCGKTNVEG